MGWFCEIGGGELRRAPERRLAHPWRLRKAPLHFRILQDGAADFSRGAGEEAVGEGFELLGEVGEVDLEGAVLLGFVEQVELGESDF